MSNGFVKQGTETQLNINCNYEIKKGIPWGYYYYNIQDRIIGNIIDGEPESDILHVTFNYINDFFEKMNKTSFDNESIEELFAIACKMKMEYGEPNYGKGIVEKYNGLQNNLLIIPPVPIFDYYKGGIFCKNGNYFLYCTYNEEEYLNEKINLNILDNNFKNIIGEYGLKK
jgi:hypothetical protein